MRSQLRLVLGIALALCCTGCSGNSVEVCGTIMMGGKPLIGATVVFSPDPTGPGRVAATGVTGSDGSFVVRTNKPGGVTLNGVEAGVYKVTVSKYIPPNGMSEVEYEKKLAEGAGGIYSATSNVPPRVELVPKEFSDSATSKLRVDVASGISPLKIEIP